MTIQSSGAISLANLQTEFGGSHPISLNEYYKNGGLVHNSSTNPNGIPTSGTIDLQDFYGSAQYVAPTARVIWGQNLSSLGSFLGGNLAYTGFILSNYYARGTHVHFVTNGVTDTIIQVAISGFSSFGEAQAARDVFNGDSLVGMVAGTQSWSGLSRGEWASNDYTTDYGHVVILGNVALTGSSGSSFPGSAFSLTFGP